MNTYRTHLLGALKKENVGEEVTLSGWIYRRRDHGGVVFVDLRDNDGVTQIVFHPEHAGEKVIDEVTHMSLESVIKVTGKVLARDDAQVNPKMKTGEIEIDVISMEVLSKVESLPYAIADESTPEELRLKNRYLDLRTTRMHKMMHMRTDFMASLRKRMWAKEFREFQTPILTASSPEGARDFLVPSRIHKGHFYALPQAPQQFKQLLMVSGFDKYFQIAPCFRDEDPRADRHPLEFYQLDMEMSFVEQNDVFNLVEDVVSGVYEEFSDFTGEKWTVDTPQWKRIPFAESMLKYSNDKPDLRNPIEICDISDIWLRTEFVVFKNIIGTGGNVRAMVAPGAAAQPRSWFDKVGSWAQKELGAPAAPGYITMKDGEFKGPLLKFLGEDNTKEVFERAGAKDGDAVFFVAAKGKDLHRVASPLRDRLAADLGIVEKNVFRFAWIVDYPMFETTDDGKMDFSHNPFSMPVGGMEALENQDPLTIKALQYDLICNGYELCSGAIRNHRPEVMYKAFELAGYPNSEVDKQFGGMIRAFKHGSPPHGGCALGIERMMMIIMDTSNIREVIAFPANGQAQDLMMAAPSEVTLEQLRDLGIQLDPRVKAELIAKKEESLAQSKTA
ncbi:MAG: aspartyl-tRNA synthetase [Alphaproteobacteria bacterium]|jgi:aspartyl-tRNA synthetase